MHREAATQTSNRTSKLDVTKWIFLHHVSNPDARTADLSLSGPQQASPPRRNDGLGEGCGGGRPSSSTGAWTFGSIIRTGNVIKNYVFTYFGQKYRDPRHMRSAACCPEFGLGDWPLGGRPITGGAW